MYTSGLISILPSNFRSKYPTATADTVPPTLVSAVVPSSFPDRIYLTWSKAMSATISAAAAFAVSAGHPLTAHTYVDAVTTYLTTSTPFTNGEAARTLAYTQPGSNKMISQSGVLLLNFSGSNIANQVTTISPALYVEYIDTSGNFQGVDVVDNVTTITGVAPFLVHFDALGSRSAIASANTKPGAWQNLGYRLNYGEGLGGTWTYGGGASRDEDLDDPYFGRVFTHVGLNQVRLKIKDLSGNEATIGFNVVVTAPPTPVNIPVSAGAWPTWVNNTQYTLDAGGNYTGFGTMNFVGKHNILISKNGSGTNPLVGTFSPTDTQLSGLGTAVVSAKNIRTLNINVQVFRIGICGFQYCGVIGNTLEMRMSYDSPIFYYEHNADTPTKRDNLRYPRGVFLQDVFLQSDAVDNVYIMINYFRRLHMINVVTHKNGGLGGGSGEHSFRNVHECCSFRYCNFYSTTSVASTCFKAQGLGASTGPGTGTPDVWPTGNDDRFGASDGSRIFGYPHSGLAVNRCQFGRAGEILPNYAWSAAPQNDVELKAEGVEYTAVENCLGFGTDVNLLNPNAVDLGGRYLLVRNFRMNMGTGGYTYLGNGDKNPNVIPAGWHGPVLHEEVNTRPVPSIF